MDNYLLEIINNTTDYIENNLLNPLNLDNISENVNISKFHLLRIWKGATSTGLMEYVRRRRIALSLSDLIHDGHSIEFISSKYSFGCERTYNRVFKEEFNITPAKWRRNPCPLEILDRFNADFMFCAGEGLAFLRSITVMPGFSIAGLEYEVDIEENKECQIAAKYGVDFFYNHRQRIFNPDEKDVYIGYTTVTDKCAKYSLYQPSIKINEMSIVPSDMKIRHIPSYKYGVFTYMGPHRPEEISSKTLSELWKLIFTKWMPTVKFNVDEPFSLEFINYAKCNKQYSECDLYFPISPV